MADDKLVELLKDAETLEDVFKKFEGGHATVLDFSEGKVISARKDYAIVTAFKHERQWADKQEGVHPYGSQLVYTFRQEKPKIG